MGALYKTTESGCQIIAESKGRGTKYTVYFPDGTTKTNLALKKAEQLCQQFSNTMKPKERILTDIAVFNFMSVCPNGQPLIIAFNNQKKEAAIFIGKIQNMRGNFVFNFFVHGSILSIIMDGLENLKIYPDESDKTLVNQLNDLQQEWMNVGQTLSYVMNSPVGSPIVVSYNGGQKQQTLFVGCKNENGTSTLGFYTPTGINTVPLKDLDKLAVFPGEINQNMATALKQRYAMQFKK